MNEIEITVEGGVIQDITGIPKGITVRVLDFDTDGTDDSETEIQDSGDRAIVSIYEGRAQ